MATRTVRFRLLEQQITRLLREERQALEAFTGPASSVPAVIEFLQSVFPWSAKEQATYFPWILKQVIAGGITPVNIKEINGRVAQFEELKKIPWIRIDKDIGQYPNYLTWTGTIDYHYTRSSRAQRRAVRERHTAIVYEDRLYRVTRIEGDTASRSALMQFSRGTIWCTKHIASADSYLAKGDMYVCHMKVDNGWEPYFLAAEDCAMLLNTNNKPMSVCAPHTDYLLAQMIQLPGMSAEAKDRLLYRRLTCPEYLGRPPLVFEN